MQKYDEILEFEKVQLPVKLRFQHYTIMLLAFFVSMYIINAFEGQVRFITVTVISIAMFFAGSFGMNWHRVLAQELMNKNKKIFNEFIYSYGILERMTYAELLKKASGKHKRHAEAIVGLMEAINDGRAIVIGYVATGVAINLLLIGIYVIESVK